MPLFGVYQLLIKLFEQILTDLSEIINRKPSRESEDQSAGLFSYSECSKPRKEILLHKVMETKLFK